jgi:putative transposase
MANTYTQLYIQIIFAVQGRENIIFAKHRDELEKYICGIINNKNSKPLAIYCNPDHTHVLVGLHPAISVSDLTRDIKSNSSTFISDKNWIKGKFFWQDGYGVFSYSKSQIDTVIKYILNQTNHHKKKSFKEEYLSILKKLDIQFTDQYLFEWYE